MGCCTWKWTLAGLYFSAETLYWPPMNLWHPVVRRLAENHCLDDLGKKKINSCESSGDECMICVRLAREISSNPSSNKDASNFHFHIKV